MTFANYIGGEWVGTDRTFENRNPADWDDLVGRFALGSAADAQQAVAAAVQAFPRWAATSAPIRAGYLFKAADALERPVPRSQRGGSPAEAVLPGGPAGEEDRVRPAYAGRRSIRCDGGNSNPTTGDFSMGISGMLIENGKMTRPVFEMNISGNLKTLWSSLAEVGNDPYVFGSWRVPTLRFKDVQFSGL
jgi:hypothetical protein